MALFVDMEIEELQQERVDFEFKSQKITDVLNLHQDLFSELEAVLPTSALKGSTVPLNQDDSSPDTSISYAGNIGRQIARTAPKMGSPAAIRSAFGSAVRYKVENPDDTESIEEVLRRCRVMPEIFSTAEENLDKMQKVYEPLYGLSREFIPTLQKNIYGNVDAYVELSSYIILDRTDTTKPDAIMTVLAQDWFDRRGSSIGQDILDTILSSNLITAEEYISELTNSEASDTRLKTWLKFMHTMSKGLNSEQFASHLATNIEFWPDELKKSFNNLHSEVKEDFKQLFVSCLERWVYINQPSPSFNDVERAWAQLFTSLNLPLNELNPAQRLELIRAEDSLKRKRKATEKAGKTALNGEAELDLVHMEIESEPAKLYALKRGKNGYYYEEDDGQAIDQMITDYASRFPGNKELAEDIKSALNFLAKNPIGVGVIKLRGAPYYLVGDKQSLVAYRLKPTGVPEITSRSKAMRAVRIEFVQLNDGSIGIIRIVNRSDKTYTKKGF